MTNILLSHENHLSIEKEEPQGSGVEQCLLSGQAFKKLLSLEDQRLWEELKVGNKDALAIIYDTHIQMLLNYGQKIISNKAIVADKIQDLFVELWEQRNRLSSTDSIKYYLLKSLRYKIIRFKNNEKKSLIAHDIPENYDFEFAISHEKALIHRMILDEQKTQLTLALSKLSSRQEEIVFLRFYNNFTYEEISSIMAIDEQSAYNLLSRALKCLYQHMGNSRVLILYQLLWLTF